MRTLVRGLVSAICLCAAVWAVSCAGSGKAPSVPAVSFVNLETTKGDILLELNGEKAPISVANFLGYVDDKFYDGLIFHRVIDGFVIQGGGRTPDMAERPGKAPIKNEWKNGLKNERGTVAMARENDPDTATCEFYINVKDNPPLDEPREKTGSAGYAVFGKVVAGMAVVDAIKRVPTTTKLEDENVPIEPIVITRAVRVSDQKAQEIIAAEAATTSGGAGSNN